MPATMPVIRAAEPRITAREGYNLASPQHPSSQYPELVSVQHRLSRCPFGRQSNLRDVCRLVSMSTCDRGCTARPGKDPAADSRRARRPEDTVPTVSHPLASNQAGLH